MPCQARVNLLCLFYPHHKVEVCVFAVNWLARHLAYAHPCTMGCGCHAIFRPGTELRACLLPPQLDGS